MYSKQKLGCFWLCILACSSILPILCIPTNNGEMSHIYPQYVMPSEARKYAEKQNPPKKASSIASNSLTPVVETRNDLSDVQTNEIPQDNGGFSWGSVLTSVMQMLFNPPQATGPSKSDSLDADQNGISPSPWANLFSVGLKILTAFLGGGQVASDGIDKVDNGSPYQGVLTAVISAFLGSKNEDQAAKVAQQAGEFVNIIVTLLDTLKQSFGHRSMAARSLGKRDTISDVAVASLTFAKGYFRVMRSSTSQDSQECAKYIICEANLECVNNQLNKNLCSLGSTATSTAIHKSSSIPYNNLSEAGRLGRNAESIQECGLRPASC